MRPARTFAGVPCAFFFARVTSSHAANIVDIALEMRYARNATTLFSTSSRSSYARADNADSLHARIARERTLMSSNDVAINMLVRSFCSLNEASRQASNARFNAVFLAYLATRASLALLSRA